jgi:Zn-dependent protease with chaperone function
MSFLLMVFLTLVCLLDSYPSPLWGGSPGLSALLTGVAVLLLGAHAHLVSRRLAGPLRRDPGARERLLRRYERGRFVHQFVLLGAFLLALLGLGWGWAVRQAWHWGESPLPNGDNYLPGLELLTLLPFLAGQLLSWMSFYDADRAVFETAQRGQDDSPAPLWPEKPAAPAPAFGGRAAYLVFQARQKLALVLIPVLLMVAQKELWRRIPASWQEAHSAVNALAILAVLGIFVCMPWVIRLVLGLKPLPAGPLRDRLLALARRLHFRCSDVLLWNTRSGMANAMVIGIVPWIRYVVFTDRLVDEFPENEVEAVFGHEVGHVKHHHMAYYFGFLTASIAVLALLHERLIRPWVGGAAAWAANHFPDVISPDSLAGPAFGGDDMAVFPVVGLLLAYIFVVFGFLSRRCERQADVYGCRAVSCGKADCLDHEPGLRLPERGRALCPTGIRTFIRALEKVAAVNGISRDRPGFLQSWQHSTIARRVEFLHRLLLDPAAEAVFQRRVAVVKWGLLVLLAGTLALLVYWHGW